MPVMKDNEVLLYEVAEMYYEHGITQAEIGKRLGLTTMSISRLLKAAREQGIVKITVARRVPRVADYEKQLVDKFELDYAIVVDATEDSHLELVPAAAAQHLQILMEPDTTVGVGVGPTISRVVANLHSQRLPDANVVQLSGGFPETGEGHSHDIVRNMSDVLGAKGIYFHAPTIFPDAATKATVLDRMTDPGLRAHWTACTMAVVTANPIRTEAMLVKAGFLTRQELAELKQLGAVGSLLANFYDADGAFIDHDINRRVASIPLDLLRKVPNVIAVNRYKNREVALLGALRTGLVNTVVTDAKAARALL